MPRYRLSTLLGCTVALCLLSAIAHWVWVRPSAQEIALAKQQSAIRAAFQETPTMLGKWRQVEHKLYPGTSSTALVALFQRWRNTSTGQTVEAWFFGGHAGKVYGADHWLDTEFTDDWCPKKRSFGMSGVSSAYSGASLDGTDSKMLILYAYSKDGEWRGAENARLELGFVRRCFKLRLHKTIDLIDLDAETMEVDFEGMSELMDLLTEDANVRLFPSMDR